MSNCKNLVQKMNMELFKKNISNIYHLSFFLIQYEVKVVCWNIIQFFWPYLFRQQNGNLPNILLQIEKKSHIFLSICYTNDLIKCNRKAYHVGSKNASHRPTITSSLSRTCNSNYLQNRSSHLSNSYMYAPCQFRALGLNLQ